MFRHGSHESPGVSTPETHTPYQYQGINAVNDPSNDNESRVKVKVESSFIGLWLAYMRTMMPCTKITHPKQILPSYNPWPPNPSMDAVNQMSVSQSIKLQMMLNHCLSCRRGSPGHCSPMDHAHVFMHGPRYGHCPPQSGQRPWPCSGSASLRSWPLPA